MSDVPGWEAEPLTEEGFFALVEESKLRPLPGPGRYVFVRCDECDGARMGALPPGKRCGTCTGLGVLVEFQADT